MKKSVKILAMVLVMTLVLSLTAFAAGAKPTIVPVEGADVTFTDNTCTVMNVSFANSAIQDGEQYVVWVVAATVVEGETVYIPTESSILYIGQAAASGTTFTFEGVYPREIKNGAVMISGAGMKEIDGEDGNQEGLYTLATIEIPYILGDADMNGYIDAVDALLILQYRAGVEGAELTDAGKLAADADMNGYIDAVDALSILQYRAGVIDSLPPKGE